MKIKLGAAPNADFTGDKRTVKPHFVEVWDITSAKKRMEEFIDDNDLGSGNLSADCGNVYSDAGDLIAKISYNLRVVMQ